MSTENREVFKLETGVDETLANSMPADPALQRSQARSIMGPATEQTPPVLRARARGTIAPYSDADLQADLADADVEQTMARGSMSHIPAMTAADNGHLVAQVSDDVSVSVELDGLTADTLDDEFEEIDETVELVLNADGTEVPAVSRKIRRRRRRERPRSKTIAMKRLTREELRVGALMFPPVDEPRPVSRAECASGEMRPCPWVACKHHLYLDINPETGSIKINFPDLEPWEMKQTCALDVAERGGITLEEVGEIMNLTRERIRQVEVRGLLRLKMGSPSPDELGADLLREQAANRRN
jgi:hypothetical protein